MAGSRTGTQNIHNEPRETCSVRKQGSAQKRETYIDGGMLT